MLFTDSRKDSYENLLSEGTNIFYDREVRNIYLADGRIGAYARYSFPVRSSYSCVLVRFREDAVVVR